MNRSKLAKGANIQSVRGEQAREGSKRAKGQVCNGSERARGATPRRTFGALPRPSGFAAQPSTARAGLCKANTAQRVALTLQMQQKRRQQLPPAFPPGLTITRGAEISFFFIFVLAF